jgi:hypothetical protein
MDSHFPKKKPIRIYFCGASDYSGAFLPFIQPFFSFRQHRPGSVPFGSLLGRSSGETADDIPYLLTGLDMVTLQLGIVGVKQNFAPWYHGVMPTWLHEITISGV